MVRKLPFRDMNVEDIDPFDALDLEEGTLVSFWDDRSRPMACIPSLKVWELKPVTCDRHRSPRKLKLFPELPPECLFSVVREGNRLGFSSVAARGRMLQATKGEGTPHLVNNHNFGPWEEWALRENEGCLVNVRFRSKRLGYSIRLVSAGCTSLLRQHEKLLSREERSLREQLYHKSKEMEVAHAKLKEYETVLQEESMAFSKKKEDLEIQLRASSIKQEKLAREALEAVSKLDQYEKEREELIADREAACEAANRAETEAESLSLKLETLVKDHAFQLESLKSNSEAKIHTLESERKRLADAVEAIARNVEAVSPCLSLRKEKSLHASGSPRSSLSVELPSCEGTFASAGVAWWGDGKRKSGADQQDSGKDISTLEPEPSLSPRYDTRYPAEEVGHLPDNSPDSCLFTQTHPSTWEAEVEKQPSGAHGMTRKRLDMDQHVDALTSKISTSLRGSRISVNPGSRKGWVNPAAKEFLNTQPLTDEELEEIMGMI